jgi:hypothetical protein
MRASEQIIALVGRASGGLGPTPIPMLSNLVFKLSADSITGLANGANVPASAWVDSQNGIVADTLSGTPPTFQTNQVGGKPSVRFGGNGNFSISAPGALKTAVDSQTYTVLIAAKTISGGGTGGFNAIFGASAGGNSFFFYSDTANAGRFDGNGTPSTAPFAGTSFFSFGNVSNPAPSVGPLELSMLNGTSYRSNSTSLAPASSSTFAIGARNGVNNDFQWNGDLFEVWVWNVALTPAQYMQAEMALCDKYSRPYPWASLSKMPVFFGDSISAGVGTTPSGSTSAVTFQPSFLAAQTNLGLTYGQYQDLSHPGITMNQMTALAPTYVNPIATQIGKKIGVICWEWANQRDSTTAAGAAMLAALKAAANVQTVFGTSTSASIYDPSADRATYDAAWDAIAAGSKTNIDSYMPIHTDTHIGVDGSYASFSGTTGGDGLHLTNATYPFLAALMSTGFSALPA